MCAWMRGLNQRWRNRLLEFCALNTLETLNNSTSHCKMNNFLADKKWRMPNKCIAIRILKTDQYSINSIYSDHSGLTLCFCHTGYTKYFYSHGLRQAKCTVIQYLQHSSIFSEHNCHRPNGWQYGSAHTTMDKGRHVLSDVVSCEQYSATGLKSPCCGKVAHALSAQAPDMATCVMALLVTDCCYYGKDDEWFGSWWLPDRLYLVIRVSKYILLGWRRYPLEEKWILNLKLAIIGKMDFSSILHSRIWYQKLYDQQFQFVLQFSKLFFNSSLLNATAVDIFQLGCPSLKVLAYPAFSCTSVGRIQNIK